MPFNHHGLYWMNHSVFRISFGRNRVNHSRYRHCHGRVTVQQQWFQYFLFSSILLFPIHSALDLRMLSEEVHRKLRSSNYTLRS